LWQRSGFSLAPAHVHRALHSSGADYAPGALCRVLPARLQVHFYASARVRRNVAPRSQEGCLGTNPNASLSPEAQHTNEVAVIDGRPPRARTGKRDFDSYGFQQLRSSTEFPLMFVTSERILTAFRESEPLRSKPTETVALVRFR
jgi:hypothetical protein